MATFTIKIKDEHVLEALKNAARESGDHVVDRIAKAKRVPADLKKYIEKDLKQYLENGGLQDFFEDGMTNDMYYGEYVDNSWME